MCLRTSCPRNAQEPVKMCLPSAPGTEAPNSCTSRNHQMLLDCPLQVMWPCLCQRSGCWDSLLLATAKHSSWRCSGGVYLTWSLRYERRFLRVLLIGCPRIQGPEFLHAWRNSRWLHSRILFGVLKRTHAPPPPLTSHIRTSRGGSQA